MSAVPSYLGRVGNTGVYKLDLSQFGNRAISQITISDDFVISGGVGADSGYDLDFITISSTNVDNPATAASLRDEAGFRFTPATAILEPGYLQPVPRGTTLSRLFSSVLTGATANGEVDFAEATLDTRDGSSIPSEPHNGVSVGEGGEITFILDSPIFPGAGGPSYLYYGDVGQKDDSFVFVDESPVFVPRSGLTLKGTASGDEIYLGQGLNINLGDGDDDVSGLGGDDEISTGPGNDRIAPGSGNDTVFGGPGVDTVDLEISMDGARVQRFSNGWQAVTSQGVDALREVEILQFLEGFIELSDSQNSGLIFITSSRDGEFLDGGQQYRGPVGYLERQLVTSGRDENVLGTSSNDFVNTLGGTDAVDAKAGDDVIDGGTGSNFLTGGSGVDIFFTDARIAGLVTWTTVTDFDPRLEEVTIWGWQPGISRGRWIASDGANGFEGATYHADVDGNGRTDTSITFTGLTQSQIQTPLVFDGLLWFE